MACAGSAGGSQPPNQHPYHLQGQCEQDNEDIETGEEYIPPPSRPKKKQGERGGAKGLKVQSLKQKLGGPIPIVWDPRFPNVRKVVGEYDDKFQSELGKIVRNHVPVYSESWRKVSKQTKELIWKEAQSTFTPLEEIHHKAVMAECSTLLRKWKGRCMKSVKAHMVANKPGVPRKFHDVDSQEEWDQYLQHIISPKFIAMSDRNKNNRAKLKYVGLQGRRSMPGYRWRRLQRNNQNQLELGEHPIELWAEKHKRNGVFVNAAAEEDYRRVIEVAERLSPSGLLSSELELQIFNEALGPRRDSVKGVGPTLSSQSASSSQSFQSPSSSTPDSEKIAQLEKELKKSNARFNRFVSTIKAHVPSLADIYEDEDEDEDLEDMDVDLEDV